MIHARRIKPKRNSTKEMLEDTVVKVSNVRVQKVSAEQGSTSDVLEASNLERPNLERSRSQSSRLVNDRPSRAQKKATKKTSKKVTTRSKAFDEAFAKANPFSRLIQKTAKENRRNRKTQVSAKGVTPITPVTSMRKFFKRLSYLAIFCVLAFTLLSLSFRTETVLVQGNSQLSPSEVQALSKIHAGTPLLWVTERNVKNLLRNPWIDNVKINREFPHTVLIELRERTPVALLSINLDSQMMGGQVIGRALKEQAAYSADGTFLPDVPADVLAGLTPIDGWGLDRSFEGLELLKYLNTMLELSVTKIDYTPEGFEASFEYGLFETATQETSFILGQLQTPSLTLLKEHKSAFLNALTTSETGEAMNMAASLEDRVQQDRVQDRFIVPAPLATTSASGGQDNQETRRIVKRKWITIYGWGVSLSE